MVNHDDPHAAIYDLVAAFTADIHLDEFRSFLVSAYERGHSAGVHEAAEVMHEELSKYELRKKRTTDGR